MKYFITLFTIFILFISISQGQDKIYFDGNWKEATEEQAEFYRLIKEKDGVFLIQDYYMSDQLQYEAISKTDTEPYKLEGAAVWYHDDGSVAQKTQFKNNEYEGKFEAFYSNGNKKVIGNYKVGKLDGMYTEYFPSGGIANEANFAQGQINGTHTKYFSEGKLEFKVDYKNGLVDGDYIIYGSNGKLFNKGQAVQGVKTGKCFDYTYDGDLRQEYIIKDGFLDGEFKGYHLGEQVTTAIFEKGKPLSYSSDRFKAVNNSVFSAEMKLISGVETWTIHRDGKLVIESFYKEGVKTGDWKFYTYNGAEVYETRNYAGTDCGEPYLIQIENKFKPHFFIRGRFDLDSDDFKEKCEGVVIEKLGSYDEHPYFYFIPKLEKGTVEKELGRNQIDYKDPTSQNDFRNKNNCVEGYKKNKGLSLCIREEGAIEYYVFISNNLETLKKIKKEAKPDDNEVYFFYQTFEERIYDFDLEERPNRYMGFALSKVMKETLRDGTLDESVIVRVLEHGYFNVGGFSGLTAFDKLEKEYKRK